MTYPLAVQLYTLRHLSSDPLELIRVTAGAGYAGIEGGHYPDLDAARVKSVLDEENVQMVSAHVGLDVFENDLSAALEYQQALGNDTVILPLDQQQRLHRRGRLAGVRQTARVLYTEGQGRGYAAALPQPRL